MRSPPAHRAPRERPRWPRAVRILWRVGLCVLLVQLAGLLTQSAYLYGHFDLTSDFALFDQAWVAIAHGHLNPESTLYRTAPYLTNHFELITYPLALLWFVFPHGITLLVAEDVATVASEAVAFAWVLDLMVAGRRRARSGSTEGGTVRGSDVVVASGVLVVLVANPWIWWADAFDFHLQVFATLFAVVAARSFWSRRGHPWVWVVLALACGAVESIVLAGLALTMLVAWRGLRREGAVLLALVVAWVVTLSSLGLDAGSQLSTNYGYLAHVKPGGAVTLSAVVAGLVGHPATAWRTVAGRWREVWQLVAGSSALGAVTVIGLPMSLVLLVPSVLNHSPTVISPIAAYQELGVFMFVPVGSFVAVRWLLARRPLWIKAAGALVGVVALVQVLVLSAQFAPAARKDFAQVSPSSTAVLSTVLAHTPADAEVVSSNGMVGRFAGRLWIYSYLGATPGGKHILVRERTVLFVLAPRQGIEEATPQETLRLIRFVRVRLGADQVAHADGIYAYLWHPGPGVRSVTLPGAP